MFVIGNGISEVSSNLGRSCFTSLGKSINPTVFSPTMGKTGFFSPGKVMSLGKEKL